MANDLALLTVAIGEEFKRVTSMTHPIMQKYAERINADFVVIDKQTTTKTTPHWEKFQIFKYLNQYRRILYMDSDIIIRDDCPNLFKIVPQEKLGILNEGQYSDWLQVMRVAAMTYKEDIPKWDRQYYNTGVMVVSRMHKQFFKKPEMEHNQYGDNFAYDQPYINLKIINGACKVHNLKYRYNRLPYMDELTGEHRLDSYIVHYAGVRSVDRLSSIIASDLEEWKNNPKHEYKRNILIIVGGGMGDQICAEPVIRYAIEELYKKDNVKVISDWPRIFQHLGIPVMKRVDFKSEHNPIWITAGGIRQQYGGYFKMETLPSPQEPLWTFLSHTLCHSTDFTAISMLRRTLPDKRKGIKMVVNEDDIMELVDVVGVRSMKDLVLVHPGRGWDSKTFPSEYWQSIVDKLAAEGLPVAVIGKHISEEQGYTPIKCSDKMFDLRDLLSLGGLIALVSQAKVMITNDSAPIHIGGAFNNWMLLIPSCKHPDHIFPYRHGDKRYKSVALYKKLTCDTIDSSPTQVDGQTIDYVIGDIMDYLPDADEVVKVAAKMYRSADDVTRMD